MKMSFKALKAHGGIVIQNIALVIAIIGLVVLTVKNANLQKYVWHCEYEQGRRQESFEILMMVKMYYQEHRRFPSLEELQERYHPYDGPYLHSWKMEVRWIQGDYVLDLRDISGLQLSRQPFRRVMNIGVKVA